MICHCPFGTLCVSLVLADHCGGRSYGTAGVRRMTVPVTRGVHPRVGLLATDVSAGPTIHHDGSSLPKYSAFPFLFGVSGAALYWSSFLPKWRFADVSAPRSCQSVSSLPRSCRRTHPRRAGRSRVCILAHLPLRSILLPFRMSQAPFFLGERSRRPLAHLGTRYRRHRS